MQQQYTSKDTSINTVTKIYKRFSFPKGAEVLDFGGGKYDTNKEYLKQKGVSCFVYDPYNRTLAHNQEVINHFLREGGSNFIVCANVLNVLKEDEIVLEVLSKIKELLKEQGTLYIQIYEGKKTGEGAVTTKGYQRNMKTEAYMPIISKVFQNVNIQRKANIIIVQR